MERHLFNSLLCIVPACGLYVAYRVYGKKHWTSLCHYWSDHIMVDVLNGKILPATIRVHGRITVYLLLNSLMFAEESVFRLWLTFVFDSFTPEAIVSIFGSAVLFGAFHLLPNPLEPKMHERKYRVIRFSATFSLGVITGILAVWFQSMIWPIVFHYAWNIVAVCHTRRKMAIAKTT